MAPVPAREPGVPVEGAERSQASRWSLNRDGRGPSRALQFALAGLILLALLALAWHFNLRPRHQAFSAMPDTLRGLAGTAVVFGIGGFGLVRLCLPEALRRYELLWVLPTGGCAVGLTMTVLGFAFVPYAASLTVVLLAGLALGVLAVRRRGWPSLQLPDLAWPLLIGFVVLSVALVPLLFRQHYAAPVGTGSDAHVATGAGQFLKHSYPTGVDITQPINRMPPTWRSKFPIYYALAAVSSISGLATWQVLAILAAALLAMAAIGMFLVARELFAAPLAVAVVAMGLAGLDRMALHTVLNPYFNQTWGFFALPFTLVLGWCVVQPGLSRRARQGVSLLLALFALVLAFAYPLAVPIPAVPMLIFLWNGRRARIRAGERVFRLRDLYKGRRSLFWLIPLCVLLAVPVYGVLEKSVAAAGVLLPGHPLRAWAGDLGHFIPFPFFTSLPDSALGLVLFAGVALLAVYGLARAQRSLAWGLGGLSVIALLLAAYLRHRPYGFYFQFKLLAFIGPVLLLMAAVGAGRLRQWGMVAIGVLVIAASASVVDEVGATGYQLNTWTIQLTGWAKSLPLGASVRLDMWPPQQLWAAYFMASRPLCSQLPLLATDYPHVPISRKADYILVAAGVARPADAVGPPLRSNLGYSLFRENPSVPGPNNCSQRRLDRLYTGLGHSAL